MHDYWRTFFEGEQFGNYQINYCIGAGAFGIVFNANRLGSDEELALKLLPPTATRDQVKEFHNEGTLLDALRGSSNVVHLRDSDEIEYGVPAAGGGVSPMRIDFHVMELSAVALKC